MSSLYEINLRRLRIAQELEDNGGELTDSLADEMAFNANDFKMKADDYLNLIEHLNSEIERGQREKVRIDAFIERKQKVVTSLQTRLLEALKIFGSKDPKKEIWRAEVGFWHLHTKRGIPSVLVTDPTKIPAEYMRQPPQPPLPPKEPDKKLIAEALKDDKEVAGAVLKQGEIKLIIE
jgi:hypothetical protein